MKRRARAEVAQTADNCIELRIIRRRDEAAGIISALQPRAATNLRREWRYDWYQGVKIRLADIDTPEVREPICALRGSARQASDAAVFGIDERGTLYIGAAWQPQGRPLRPQAPHRSSERDRQSQTPSFQKDWHDGEMDVGSVGVEGSQCMVLKGRLLRCQWN